MRRNPGRYAGSVEDYCVDPAPAQAATGLDVPSANAEMERLLGYGKTKTLHLLAEMVQRGLIDKRGKGNASET
jgi:hypothetical protein